MVSEKKRMNYSIDQISEKVKTAPLSFSQQQMWVIEQIQPGNHAYNLPVGYRLKGKLDVQLLEDSFNEIIKRHDSLRTTFAFINEEARQIIHPEFSIKIKIIDMEDLHTGKQLSRIASEEVIRPFDLSSLPLVRVTLIRINEFDHVLLLNLHHIISDGWSLGIISNELSILYNSRIEGMLPELPELTAQYSDFVTWQQEKNWKPTYNEQLSFWKEQLKGELPNIELPLDKQRPAVQSLNGSNEFFYLPGALVKKIQSVGFRRGSTFFMTILTALQTFLHKYSGGEDIIIGTPVSNRPRKTDENIVGNYINTVAVRANLGNNPQFSSLLRQTRKSTIDALTNRDLPFEKIVENIKIRRDLSRNPVFQVMLQVLPKYSFNLSDLQISSFNFDHGYSQFDLSFHMYEEEEGYQCRIEYSTDLFKPDTIRRMADNFVFFLNALAEHPDSTISDVSVLNETERNKVLYEWNNTASDFPDNDTVISLFEKAVLLNGDKPAVQYRDSVLTYRELNHRANLLANYLQRYDVKSGSLVGVCIERSGDMMVALLGILKTGAAYLPLDPSFPVERLNFIINDAEVPVLISQDHLKDIFPGFKGKVVTIDNEWKEIKNEGDENPGTFISPSDLAYTIYTSGSSGKPKGVLIEHRALINFLTSMQRQPGINDKDVLLAVTTISFDISILELFLPLISGALVVIAGKDEAVDGRLLLDLISKTNTTILQATPSTWKLMIESGWKKTPGLKMLCGGEAFTRELADKLIERGKELWNMYGPTETTIWSSVSKISAGAEPVFIGRPIANTTMYIVDKNMHPVPVGVPGELLIGGTGLARGYLNRPELNEERFIKNPFDGSVSRLYRTGDLVRHTPDGEIEFIGRTDFQVKLRGYRIELGEIESILMQHPDIKEVVVTAKQNKNGDKQLAAYLIPVDNKELKLNELRTFLKEKLPDYMVPAAFVKMDKFPLTPNAKVDRKALPEPETGGIESGSLHIAPRNDPEKKMTEIWERILGRSNISVNDNFFDIGGHSLLAVQMFAELENVFDVKLPLATLFEHQTVSELVEALNSDKWKEHWSSLIRIKRGIRTPLFLVHGAEGNILVYKDLANHLERGQSLYALQSKGLNGSDKTLTNIEEMAADYINEIKKIQPNGPYNLGGYCLGGTIALEMSQQLTRNGETVKNLFLIETYNICTIKDKLSNTLVYNLENIKFHYDNLMMLSRKDRIKFLRNKTEVLKRRVLSRFIPLFSKLGININSYTESSGSNSRIREVNDKAQLMYIPEKYEGKAVLLKPKVNYSSGPDPSFGWNSLINGSLKVYNLDIAPRGMLYEPFVKETAAIITKELDGI
jgi:surfactin family lipopeptide synthetase A